jgi:hypothetical protein
MMSAKLSDVPSFLYSPLDNETRMLTEELESLGGGDAKAVNMGLHCVVDDRLEKKDSQVIWPGKDAVEVRDALMPRNAPISECMKRFPATDSHSLTDVLRYPNELPIVRYDIWSIHYYRGIGI